MRRGNKSLYKWSRSHDQDGRQAHICKKPLETFSSTENPMIFKHGMRHLGLKLFNVCINDGYWVDNDLFNGKVR